jgi:DNA-directed RNA polymerase specialized sigma24 family protein
MSDSGEVRIPQHHVAELSCLFAAHDRWLFGHACVRTHGDRELAADLVQDTFEAAARAWAALRWQDRMKASEIAAELGVAEGTVHAHLHSARGKLIAGLRRYYPFGQDSGKGEPS